MGAGLEIVQTWVDACNRGNVEAALALCDPAMELEEAEELPGAVKTVGLAETRRYLERFEAHWSEGSWEPIEFREADDKVYMRARLRLIGQRSGIEVDREWIYVFTIRNGKLIRQQGFDDEADGLSAAGLA